MSKLLGDGKVLVTKARLSYPSLWAPSSFDGSDPKYEASLLVPKDDEETIKLIKDAIKTAAEEKGIKLRQDKQPLRDGDEERPDDEAYAGHYFFNARSKYQPQVVLKYKDPETKKPMEATEEDVYAGCYVNAVINFYPYSFAGGGVAAGLGNVQKHSDGPRFASISKPEDEFDFEDYDESDDDDDSWFI